MSELVRRADMPRATIQGYARQGLLPPAERVASNRFLYDDRHVRALRLIRLLRDRRGLSLDDIAEVLPELLGESDDEAFNAHLWGEAVGSRLAEIGHRAPRQRLVRAGVDLFSRQSVDTTSIEDLCARAEMAKGSFYQHFASKDDLLFAAAADVVDRAVQGLAIALDEDAIDVGATASRLAEKLATGLPLILELTAGAIRGRHGHREALASVRERVVNAIRHRGARVGVRISTDEALAIARQAVGDVVSSVLRAGFPHRTQNTGA